MSEKEDKKLPKARLDELFRSIPLPLSEEDYIKLGGMEWSGKIDSLDMPEALREAYWNKGAETFKDETW